MTETIIFVPVFVILLGIDRRYRCWRVRILVVAFTLVTLGYALPNHTVAG